MTKLRACDCIIKEKNIYFYFIIIMITILSSCSHPNASVKNKHVIQNNKTPFISLNQQATENSLILKLTALTDEYNYCKKSSDCAVVTAACPLDCYLYAHKSKVDEINNLKHKYLHEIYKLDPHSVCIQECMPSGRTVCHKNKCIGEYLKPVIKQ